MKAVLQRVSRADVVVDGDTGNPRGIGPGLVVLAGFCEADTDAIADFMAAKIVNLRIFEDENSAMNHSLLDVRGELLVVSQFTLYASCRKGRRPSFTAAARPERAIPLYERFLRALRETGVPLQTGEFGADMRVSLVNDGPVTILLDSDEIMPK